MEVIANKVSKIDTCEELYKELAGHNCTEHYYHLPYHSPRMNYTDGVKAMVEKVQAHWLLDAIQSFLRELLNNQRLSEFALIRFESNPDNSATLTIREDSHFPPAFKREFNYTTFPVSTFEMFLEHGVLLLKSEH